jgi:type I restriction enzyme S subunit
MNGAWEWKRLGDVLKTGSGGTPLKATKKYYEGGTIPWIMSGEVSQGDVWEATNYITQEGLENSSAKIFPKDTVLVAMYGATAGQVGILRFEAATNQAVCGILPDRKFLPKFLFYVLLSKKEELIAQAIGNAQPNISQIKIKNTTIPILSLAEQKRMVAILDQSLEAIDTAKSNSERNRQNANAVFQSYLTETFEKGSANWQKKSLRDVSLVFGRGKSKHRPRNDPKLYGGRYPFIQTGDVRNTNHLITEYTQTYNEAGLAQSQLWKKGTLCITIAANIAETGVLDFDACFPDSIIGVTVDEQQTSSKFLEYLLRTVKAELKAKGKGSAQDNINLATFENELFRFPDVRMQSEIVERVDELSISSQQLEAIYENKLVAHSRLAQSLLATAFEGKL